MDLAVDLLDFKGRHHPATLYVQDVIELFEEYIRLNDIQKVGDFWLISILDSASEY